MSAVEVVVEMGGETEGAGVVGAGWTGIGVGLAGSD